MFLNIKHADISDQTEKKINNFNLLNRVGFYLFLSYLALGILLNIFADISLTLDYPILSQSILWGFLFVVVCIQLYLYYLYRKIGKGTAYLKKRGALLGVAFIFILFMYFYF